MITLKKRWAKECRDAMWKLYSGNDADDCGDAEGLCEAIDDREIVSAIKDTIDAYCAPLYWWRYSCSLSDYFLHPKYTARAYTARIIALELFALICEEEGE